MRRPLRLFGLVLFVPLALILLSLAVLYLIPSERVAAIASRGLEQATGRGVHFTGGLRPVVWPRPGIRTGAVEVDNAPWSVEGPMIMADGVMVGVRLWPLLSGRVELSRLELDRPRVLLERDAEGRANWQFGEGQAQGQGGIRIAQASVRDGTLTYIDRRTGYRRVLAEVEADMSLPDPAGALGLRATGVTSGRKVGLKLSAGSFADFTGGAAVPMDIALESGANRVDFSGTAGLEPRMAQGGLKIHVSEPFLLLGAGGSAAGNPPAPPPVPIKLSGQIDWAAERQHIALSQADVTLGANRMTGSAELDLSGQRPRLSADVAAQTLTLPPPPPGAERDADGWSMAPIQTGWLHPVDATVRIRAEAVKTPDMTIDPVSAQLTLDRARAVLVIDDARVHDGTIRGEVVMNDRSGLSVGGRIGFEGVALGPLLGAVAKPPPLTGKVTGQVDFLGTGTSVGAIMNSLSGAGDLRIGEGTLSGIDMPAILRRGTLARGASTPFGEAAGTFRIRQGVLENDDLVLNSPLLSARGEGIVGIGPRTLNYRLTPEAAPATRLGRIRVPVLITGTWAAPEIRLGVQSPTDEAVAEERRKLESQEGAPTPTTPVSGKDNPPTQGR